MRLKIASVLATAALLTACGSNDECLDAEGKGGHHAHDFAPGSAADFAHNVGDRVYFDTDKSMIKGEGKETIHRQAHWLNQFHRSATIQGHCDERGTEEYNLALGERRANAVKNGLMSHGVSDAHLKVVSFGKNRPIVLGHTQEAWAKNRVAITVIDE